MSNKEPADKSIVFSVIKLVVGILIFLIIALLMQTWELQREDALASSGLPGTTLYLAIPFLIGILTFGTAVFAEGFFPVLSVIIQSARDSERKVRR